MNKKPQEKGIRKKGILWYVNIQVDGKRREIKAGSNKSEAIALRNRLKLMAYDGSLHAAIQNRQEQQTFTYSQAINEHWEAYLKFKKSGADMLGRLKSSKTLFGSRDISTLTWQEIEGFRNKRLSEVKPATVKQDLDMMHAVFQRQIKQGRLKENPLDKVERPTFNNVREEVISHIEFLDLLSAHWEIDNRGSKTTKYIDPHLQLALIIADFTAMRISEVLNMRWSDIKNDYDYIFVPESKTQVKRQVPVHDELKKILSFQVRESDYVVNYRGKQIDRIKKGFEMVRSIVKMPELHIHDFRHRAITRWVQEGHPVNAIMKATGHSTFSSFSRYANLKEGDIQVLVGRKTSPLPVLSFEEYLKISTKKKCGRNVERQKVA